MPGLSVTVKIQVQNLVYIQKLMTNSAFRKHQFFHCGKTHIHI